MGSIPAFKKNTTSSNRSRGVCEVGSCVHRGRLFVPKSSVNVWRELESLQQRQELQGSCRSNSCLDGVRVIRVYLVGMNGLYYSARICTCGGRLLLCRVHSGCNSH